MNDFIDFLLFIIGFFFILSIIIKKLFLFISINKKKIFYISLFSILCYVADKFTFYFLWTLGIIFALLIILSILGLIYGYIEKKSLSNTISVYLSKGDNDGLCKTFTGLENDKKKLFISLLTENNELTNKVDLLKKLLLTDFIVFAGKYGFGDYAILEKDLCIRYVSGLWGKLVTDLWRCGFLNGNIEEINNEINNFNLGWNISEEKPHDDKTGKTINLIKLTKSNVSMFDNAIVLD
jgi:hypothetical protein